MFDQPFWMKTRAAEFWDTLVRHIATAMQGDTLPTDAADQLRAMLSRRRAHLMRQARQRETMSCSGAPFRRVSGATDCAILLSIADPKSRRARLLANASRRAVRVGIRSLRQLVKTGEPDVQGSDSERTTYYHRSAELQLNLLLLRTDPGEFGIGPSELADLRVLLEERAQVQPA